MAAELQSLGRLEPDYVPAYQAWQASPSPETRAGLLKHIQPVVEQAVRSAAGSRASPHIHSRAKLMAVKSFDSYDPTRGPLKNHVLSQLRSLQRTVGQEQNILSVPEQVSLDRSLQAKAENELHDKLGRDPSAAEVADHTGLSLKRLAHVHKYRPATASGSILDREGEVYAPASNLPGDTTQEDAWTEFLYHDLSPIDQMVLDHTLGLHGRAVLPNQDIAQRLNLTPSAISQRKTRLQGLLDSRQQLGF